jgi:hypothetical protein
VHFAGGLKTQFVEKLTEWKVRKMHGMGSLKNSRNGNFKKMHGMGNFKKWTEWEV